ncbi:hypothetical protein U1Q18_015898, partial [Sarracenia purpurea var. burkii]
GEPVGMEANFVQVEGFQVEGKSLGGGAGEVPLFEERDSDSDGFGLGGIDKESHFQERDLVSEVVVVQERGLVLED